MRKTASILLTLMMCLLLAACGGKDSSEEGKRGDLGKLIDLTPEGNTVITGIQLEHQGVWRDEPEIEEIVSKYGFSKTSAYYEFELNEYFAVYVKSSTNEKFTNYLVRYNSAADYKSLSESSVKQLCIDKSLDYTYPSETDEYGDMGCLRVDEENGGSTGEYAVVIFRAGKPEAMIRINIVPSTLS